MTIGSIRSHFVLNLLVAIAAVAGVSVPSLAQDIDTHDLYVKMDYWVSPSQQSAEAWHFDEDNNGDWTQLPNHPNPPDARTRAKFRIDDLLKDSLIEDDWVWFLAVESIQVVGGNDPENFQVLSGENEYSEMIDMMVFGLDGDPIYLDPHDPCGSRIWPIATGSEMTSYELDPHPDNHLVVEPKHYGMLMHQDWLLEAAAWRWKNPAGVSANENVYIRFTLKFDYVKRPNDYLYTNCGVSWISAGGGCAYNFCVTDAQTTVTGSVFDLGALDRGPILVAVPHTLDHTTNVRFYKRVGQQDTLLIERTPTNSNNHYTAHKCEPDGATISWHNHSSGSAGHLVKGGLAQWQGNEDPGDGVFVSATMNVSTHATSAPTDHRGLYMVFWRRRIIQ